ncbi:MAG: SDR family oxidoreductase [Acidimicrobiia bacterium]|nr:SDR family oxidoreductase [Acidimicrobiia bacterium]
MSVPLYADLDGRSAVVTGAGGGVGYEIAGALATAGALVWINDLDADRASEAAEAITSNGGDGPGGARPVVADVTDADAIAAMAETTGPVDIVVNNAGLPLRRFDLKRFAETEPQSWHEWIEINLFGVMQVTHTYLSDMLEQEWGRVVTIVSDAGRVGERGQVVYGAAKAGAMGFTRGLAMEVGRHGVTANCIALGSIRHGVISEAYDANPEIEAKILRNYPVGRLGTPADPAPLAVLLCSEAGSWITGQVYPVNGGYSSSL